MSGPWQFRPISQGANNLVQLVETPASGSFVLRLVRNHSNIARLNYEFELLARLQALKLSFAVPDPVLISGGKPYLSWPDINGSYLLILSPLLSGSFPDRTNPAQNYAAGQALAELDLALEQINIEVGPNLTPALPYGDLRHLHPLVPDPVEALAQFTLAKEERDQLEKLFEDLEREVPLLYATLPLQIIHGDYDPSNILTEGNRVTGVLDFEFSGPDLRAMDLVVALSWWPHSFWDSGKEWEIIGSFGQGYASRIALTLREIEALPILFCLRAVASLVHRLGRFRQGLEREADILNRVKSTLRWKDRVRDKKEFRYSVLDSLSHRQ